MSTAPEAAIEAGRNFPIVGADRFTAQLAPPARDRIGSSRLAAAGANDWSLAARGRLRWEANLHRPRNLRPRGQKGSLVRHSARRMAGAPRHERSRNKA